MAISKSAASKSYNKKTLAKMKERDAAKKAPANSGGGSKTPAPVATNQATQLEAMKQTLLKMQSDLKAGNVTGLTPSPTTTPTTTPNANTINAGYAQALAAKNATATVTPNANTINAGYAQALRLKTTDPVPSTALTNPLSPTDVMDYRAKLEGIKGSALKIQEELNALKLVSQEDPMTPDPTKPISPTNYDQFLTRYNTQGFEKTEAQKEQERLLNESAGTVEDFYKNRDKNVDKAYDEYGVTDKQKALGNIQKEMAEREVRLRESVKNLETAPEYRGVSREFAVDQREAIKSEGAFDLANLSIVESAYRGDLETARTLATDLIDNQFKTFEGKLEGYKARLATLIPQLNADEKQQALLLEQAFDAQSRALAEKKADTELKYEYMTLAAQAGAPESVYKAILKATSADEAFMLAAPYMQKKTTTGGTTGGGVTTPVGGITPVVPGMSPWTSGLANLDLGNTKTKIGDIKAGVREQFDQAFSAKLIGTLTDEQLREFLIGYQSNMMEKGQSLPPEEAYQKYLVFLGKDSTTGGNEIANPFR